MEANADSGIDDTQCHANGCPLGMRNLGAFSTLNTGYMSKGCHSKSRKQYAGNSVMCALTLPAALLPSPMVTSYISCMS